VSGVVSCGNCGFSVPAPTLWNRLPVDFGNGLSLEENKSVMKKKNSFMLLSQVNSEHPSNPLLCFTEILF